MSDEKNPINLTGDVTPVAEGLKANLDALPKGTNKLFQTFLGKKHADSIRYQMLLAAQTEADMAKITSGEATFINGELVSLTKERPEITSASLSQLMQIKQEEETTNLAGCMREAIKDSLAQQEEASDTPVAEKFFSRWRNEAIHISDQDEQQLWGKVLSEENQKEGSFSLSTIDVLRNLDKKSAELFTEICKFVAFGEYIILNDDFGIDKNITTDVLYRLSELGLLTISMPVRTSTNIPVMPFGGEEVYYLDVPPYLILINKSEEKLSFLYAKLTNAGREIYKIAIDVHETTISNICNVLLKTKPFANVEKISFGRYKIPIQNNYYQTSELTQVFREV